MPSDLQHCGNVISEGAQFVNGVPARRVGSVGLVAFIEGDDVVADGRDVVALDVSRS
jgi:hypothetical protein